MNNTCCRCGLDQVLEDTLHPGGLKLTQRLAEVTLIKPGSKVLEIGCGKGISSLFFAQHYVCSVTGIDISPIQIASAREKAESEKLAQRTTFIAADCQILPFCANSFDVALSECSISLVPDKNQVLDEVRRVLKPGGRFTITDLFMRDDKVINTSGEASPLSDGSFASFPCVDNAETIDGYTKLFQKAGFHILYTEDCSLALKEALFRMRLRFGRTDTLLKEIACTCDKYDSIVPVLEHRKPEKKGSIGYALITATKEQIPHGEENRRDTKPLP